MLIFPFGLNSKAVGDRKACLQFNFSGEVTESCYFVIENDHVEAKEGKKKSPDITIETPFEIWMDIMTGKADGQQMFMEQKYKVDGDLSLMIQLFRK
ncbi:MAG: SCP2 sterol-binding domain-containing protein [Desulfobacterales bacterium]